MSQYKVVPIESTSAMDIAGSCHRDGMTRGDAECIWTAMINAAPDTGMIAVRRKDLAYALTCMMFRCDIDEFDSIESEKKFLSQIDAIKEALANG